MAAASPPPPWVVLSRSVDIARLSVDTEDQDAVAIRCASRKAYGCGEHGQDLVNGITLLARTVDYPNLTSSLSILITDAAIGIVQAELGKGDEPLVQIGGLHGMDVRGAVHYAAESLLVVVMYFSRTEIGGREGYYYLVHDAVAGSLSMIVHPPSQAVCTFTPRALAVRRGDDDGVDLLLVGRLGQVEFPEHGHLRNDVVLCACPLAGQPQTPSSGGCCSSVGPWQLKKRRYGRDRAAPEPFRVNAAFSSDGQAFWADLSRGVVRCDMRTAGDLAHHVDFDFICLPPGFELDSDVVTVSTESGPGPLALDMEIPVITFRALGHDGDSVVFVSLSHPAHPMCRDNDGKRMVTAWTLQQDRRRRRRWWRRDAAFSVRSLWDLEGFKSAGLPETEPYCPVLMPDGALCFLLPNKCRRLEDALDVYVCVLDLRSMSILWSARFRNHFTSAGPTLLSSDFFSHDHPLVPSERKQPSIVVTQD